MARLHSVETMGLFDGPGIRTIFFLQGCPLRCAFCHNVDTQDPKIGKEITVEQIVSRSVRMKPYFEKSGGGVTFSGGEPLLQGKFLVEAIKALRKENIHVAVDTSGFGDVRYYDSIIGNANLILLDVKHYEKKSFRDITEVSNQPLLYFMESLKKHNTPIWIRHVMMPGVTDSKYHMEKLCEFILPLKNIIEKIEILPYHTMGIEKYKTLGIDYKLKDMPPMDKEVAKELEIYINNLFQYYTKS